MYAPRYDPVFLSRFFHLALSLTSLFVSAARDRAGFRRRRRTENLPRANARDKGTTDDGFLSTELR